MVNFELLKAAREGDYQKTKQALGQGAFLETRRPLVVTPETHAPVRNNAAKRAKGLTPLMYAVQGGYHSVCQELISSRANVNAVEEDGLRPLHFAAQQGDLELCRLLVENGADRTAEDDEGKTAAQYVPLKCLQSEKEQVASQILQ